MIVKALRAKSASLGGLRTGSQKRDLFGSWLVSRSVNKVPAHVQF
jgi:hypothetical protein